MSCRFEGSVLLLAISIVGCGKIQEAKLHGTWVGHTAGFSKNGKTAGFRETWTFKDGKITRKGGNISRDQDAWSTYKVDATKEPKQIDITRQFPEKEGKAMMGIYKIENDTLTIFLLEKRIAKADATRPENFDTPRHDAILITFLREKALANPQFTGNLDYFDDMK